VIKVALLIGIKVLYISKALLLLGSSVDKDNNDIELVN
jgi:hypothetical protein